MHSWRPEGGCGSHELLEVPGAVSDFWEDDARVPEWSKKSALECWIKR